MVTDHDIHPIYFDTLAQPMSAADWHKAYPKRLDVRHSAMLGLLVLTQFVGLNHSSDARGTPWIYETVVLLPGGDVAFSWWSGGLKRSLVRHYIVNALVCMGGALWWRYRARRMDR